MTSPQTLRAQGLRKSYQGREVVCGIGLSVKQGEIVGLLGPNGAGKTTFFSMMVGLVRADAGSIWLDGLDLTPLPLHLRAHRGLGYLPQEASIFRDLTVEENLQAVLELRPLSGAQKEALLLELLGDFGLERLKKSKGLALSGGERRRVEIARALCLGPKFLLFDEPFAGVDPLAVADIQKVIKGLKHRGLGILITDHNVRETLGIVDRGHIVGHGKVLAQGPPESIIADERARRFYLGEEFQM